MRLFHTREVLLAACVVLWFAVPIQGALVIWTDWTSATADPDTVTGSMGGVDITYAGDYQFVQLGTGTDYWTEPDPNNRPYTGSATIDNAPTPSEMIALNVAGTHTITFSRPVVNPIMTIVSLGTPTKPVTYDFDTPFILLSEGKGFWGDGNYTINPGDILSGSELHCAIQFQGTVTQIEWASAPSENWHGITVGVVVPEPTTLLIWSVLGVLGMIAYGRRK